MPSLSEHILALQAVPNMDTHWTFIWPNPETTAPQTDAGWIDNQPVNVATAEPLSEWMELEDPDTILELANRDRSLFEYMTNYSGTVVEPGLIQTAVEVFGVLSVVVDRASRLLRVRPLIVFGTELKSVEDIEVKQIQLEERFLVSHAFIGGPGDSFYDLGARPGYIGVRVLEEEVLQYAFRAPRDREVAFRVKREDGRVTPVGFVRFESRSSPVWHSFQPWPEKVIAAMLVFTAADPDQIYRFFARVLSQFQHEWQEENRGILTLLDPRPGRGFTDDFLFELAQQYGHPFNTGDAPDMQRQKLTDQARMPRVRGTAISPILTFHHKNLRGEVYEVWANAEIPPGWHDVADADSAIIQHMDDIGILDQQITDSGLKTTDIVAAPHGYFDAVPFADIYWPTGRLLAVVKTLDGGPVGLEGMSSSQRQDFMDSLVQGLNRVIPGHADVRLFADGLEVEGKQAGGKIGELLGVQDELETDDQEWLAAPNVEVFGELGIVIPPPESETSLIFSAFADQQPFVVPFGWSEDTLIGGVINVEIDTGRWRGRTATIFFVTVHGGQAISPLSELLDIEAEDGLYVEAIGVLANSTVPGVGLAMFTGFNPAGWQLTAFTAASDYYLLTWGNGTLAQTGRIRLLRVVDGAATLLEELANDGFGSVETDYRMEVDVNPGNTTIRVYRDSTLVITHVDNTAERLTSFRTFGGCVRRATSYMRELHGGKRP